MIRSWRSSATTILLVFVAWKVATTLGRIPEYLLPAPETVLAYAAQHWLLLAQHLAITFLEASVGLGIALVGALLLSATMALSPPVKNLTLPVVVGMQAVPVIAIAPLLSIWFGIGFVSKAAMAMLLCWFPMVINAVRGFESVTNEQIALFSIYGASRRQVFLKLQIPQSMRFLVSGARTSAGLAMIGAIVAEYTGSGSGLGYLIMQSTYRLDTPQLFTAILLAAASGLFLSWLVGLSERTLFRRYLRT